MLYFLLSYSETGSPPVFTPNSEKRLQPEFFITDTLITRYNEDGAPDVILKSEKVTQKPEDKSVDMTQPRVNVFREGETSWNISAQTGTIYDDGNRVNLMQRVKAVSSDRQTLLKTSQMMVQLDKKTASTDRPVTLVNTNGFTKAVGMEANLDKKQIDLLDKVTGQYEPKALIQYVE